MFSYTRIDYKETSSFSKLVLAYIDQNESLQQFFAHSPTIEGIISSIQSKQAQFLDRELLYSTLKRQYQKVSMSDQVALNLESLKKSTTFSICTAHQPNLFTGPLYFIYKILHTIKLATSLNRLMPKYRFVPVYYMGSEDADFAELNHTYVQGTKIEWKKVQSGAVGRMLVDDSLISLIGDLEGQLISEPFGEELIGLLKKYYTLSATIQDATFGLVNELYADHGLVVVIPDSPEFKQVMINVFTDDLLNHTPFALASETSERISEQFPAQAYPRPVNLFYLKDNIRERIEKSEGIYTVLNTELSFSEEEILQELKSHPERFSPNVILRGLYQESILPNVAFIGGGGELAYWLQLKDLFQHYQVSYPVLILRNSFLIIKKKWQEKIDRLKVQHQDLFRSSEEILKEIAIQAANHPVKLDEFFPVMRSNYAAISGLAKMADTTLVAHVASLEKNAFAKLAGLEKKMIRAEKKKHQTAKSQIEKLKQELFPTESLQERVENFSSFYALWGKNFITELLKASPDFDQQFTVLSEG